MRYLLLSTRDQKRIIHVIFGKPLPRSKVSHLQSHYHDIIPESSFVARVGGVDGRKRIRREIDIIEDLFEIDGLTRYIRSVRIVRWWRTFEIPIADAFAFARTSAYYRQSALL